MKQTIIFDLDGTLVDVIPLFVQILNTLAPEFGYTPLSPKEVAGVKRLNLATFLFRKLGLRFWRYKAFHERGRALYQEHLKAITWFPGMVELYQELKSQGKKIGVISTNSSAAITDLLAQKHLSADFVASTSFFGKARAIKKALRQNQLDRKTVVYVGDELRDIKACQTIDLDIIAVTWGLNAPEVLKQSGVPTADTVTELHALLFNK